MMNKRFLSLILAMVLVLTALPTAALAADVVASGTCGENLTWELTSDGVLTIAGVGEMETPLPSPWLDYVNLIEVLVIMEGVTSIDSFAFQNCTALTYASIPGSVTDIWTSAFSGCTNLARVELSEGLTEIWLQAFSGCTSLSEITIPDSVTSIGQFAFEDCTGLTSVRLGRSTAGFHGGTFSGCKNLAEITVAEENSRYSSKDGVLFNKEQTTLIRIPCALGGEYIIPNGITELEDSAFQDCTNLTSITIPEGITHIWANTFRNCTGLTDMVVPMSVVYIGNGAFRGCSGLREIVIPSKVEWILSGAFQDCANLVAIDVAGDNPYFTSKDGILFNKEQTDLVQAPGTIRTCTIPSSIKSFGGLAFAGCSQLHTVVFLGDAPEYLDSFTFTGVTATVYYPENNDTWTKEYFHDYGGTLTWVAGLPEDSPTENFSDVSDTDYFYAPVLWAYTNNITTGTTPTTFSPNNACTRAQIVTFLWRAMGEPEPQSNTTPFTDLDKNEYYYKAVLWAVEEGITTGMSATTFEPNRACTRSQAVTFQWRAAGCPTSSANNPFADIPTGQWYTEAVLWAVEQGITTGISADKFAPNNTCTRAHIVTFLYRNLSEN